MIRSKSLNKKSFAVYGLGVAGKSVVKFLIKHNVKKIIKWDDNKENRRTQKIKGNLVNFKKKLKHVDYIIVSPGIKLNKKNALTNIF